MISVTAVSTSRSGTGKSLLPERLFSVLFFIDALYGA